MSSRAYICLQGYCSSSRHEIMEARNFNVQNVTSFEKDRECSRGQDVRMI